MLGEVLRLSQDMQILVGQAMSYFDKLLGAVIFAGFGYFLWSTFLKAWRVPDEGKIGPRLW